MNTELYIKRRDQRLRKRLLQVMDAAKVHPESGWVSGRFVYDVIDASMPHFTGDDHFAGLVRDLIGAGYVEERDDRRYRAQRQCIDLTSYRITPKGTLLLSEDLPVDPLIEDARRQERV